jgi:hypothetical protein
LRLKAAFLTEKKKNVRGNDADRLEKLFRAPAVLTALGMPMTASLRAHVICVLALLLLSALAHAETAPQVPETQMPMSQRGQGRAVSGVVDEALCPPDGSIVAYIDREGTEQRRYGRFLDDVLLPAIRSRGTDPAAIPEYLAMITDFARSLQAKGLNVYAGGVIVHEQTQMTRVLSSGSLRAHLRADWELQLAVMNELQRQICNR